MTNPLLGLIQLLPQVNNFLQTDEVERAQTLSMSPLTFSKGTTTDFNIFDCCTAITMAVSREGSPGVGLHSLLDCSLLCSKTSFSL